ncbi:N-glycosidase YbiA [Psilocybe cubensis]|uniref:N-glycosidase YbiA n=2 Tax=Psilocybe cubensis TaxID=181762 RepID=A0ACB8H032_PSICU|nr:N-glycosidase YbiA [Psilocybe cubensis]KAH9481194.1 N-glycosidase YbiA [Psilocybe cubensis]
MQTRQTITIVTSPSVNTRALPPIGGLTSPTATKGPVYRVEERSRTIYVSSDVDPSQWDTHSLNTMFTLAETSENGQEGTTEPIRRTHSYVDSHIIITEDVPDQVDEPRITSPRVSVYRSRRPVIRGAGTLSPPLPEIPKRSSPVKTSPARQRILFYHKHDPHYGFTNFSPHPVIYNGKKYPTSEHLFQSFKFQQHRPNLAEHIRTCSERPSVAFSEARRFQPEVRPDWKQVNIEKMDETLFYKFTQHADLQAELLATGDAELIEDSDKDAFWGVGADRKGRNELGKCLERLRAKLRGNGC